MNNSDIVQKLWNLCDILRDDGINYSEYVSELVLLLFIKMEHEQVRNNLDFEHKLPIGNRWIDLAATSDDNLILRYQEILQNLGKSNNALISTIYADAKTRLKEPHHLKQLIKAFDSIDWFSARQDGLGDLYEGLLEKNANETKSGAGQYFTPRALIDSIIRCVRPQPGESIQDPAAGTAGFLIAADAFIKQQKKMRRSLSTTLELTEQTNTYIGVELVPTTRRLALMNCVLHGIESDAQGMIKLGNALSSLGADLPKADIILSNPPFGTAKGGGGPTRTDLTYHTTNKQLAFLQHIYLGLNPGGRAAVVLPDNVLFEAGVGAEIRRDLMSQCNLHTILRLPTGIFYAHGVKTNVLFFQKAKSDISGKNATKRVWIYDLRTNVPNLGKRNPFNATHLKPFESAFGSDPNGTSPRAENIEGLGETSRFRSFTREQIRQNDDSLDITWLKDSDQLDSALPSPETLAAEIIHELTEALRELDVLLDELGAADEAEEHEKTQAETSEVYCSELDQ
ncbi:SAM-dependent DNA methyltransferase [Pseudomonas yamanorum]|uniref:type I restriction-modification system subunit M n=1 Tax=Pseudomonas yamanorum TaxID=515393 RepID=UPI0015A252A9|nr:class I SAM-dependent DNA methyltransferase [Pseudomonas yamanorum]NVZ80981.1 SAM-dependent DNA methyltransferase [Pseudomonas yamanorum]